MKVSGRTTFLASLIGSFAGIAAWRFGIGEKIWPVHPQLALFLLTLAVTVVMVRILAHDEAVKQKPG